MAAAEAVVGHCSIRAFTEKQLAALYKNKWLNRALEYSEYFVTTELNQSSRCIGLLPNLLKSYFTSRSSLLASQAALDRSEANAIHEEAKTWHLIETRIDNSGTCHDKVKVVATHRHDVAEFDGSACIRAKRIRQDVKEELFERHSLYLYHSSLWRSRVHKVVHQVCQKSDAAELRQCASVLFSFQRTALTDQQFVRDTRQWLDAVIAVMLQCATFEEHLFILHHVLRCPAGLGHWAASYVQPKVPIETEDDLDQLVALLATLLSPVQGRSEALRSPVKDKNASWVVLDSEGEEEDVSGTMGTSLRENDLVALLNQLPIDAIFRKVLIVDHGPNGQDVYDPSLFSLTSCLRLLAFSTQFVRLLSRGLSTFQAPQFGQLAKRLGRLVRHTVLYISDHWEAFRIHQESYGQVDQSMLERIKVEYNSFFLRSVQSIFRSKSGMWQYLTVLPYATVSPHTLWTVYALFHLAAGDDQAECTNHFYYEQNRLTFDSLLAELPEQDVVFLLTALANMGIDNISKDSATTNSQFVQELTSQLIHITYYSESELFSKTARHLMSNLASVHPCLLSYIVTDMDKNGEETIQKERVVYLFKDLPFQQWKTNCSNIHFKIPGSWITTCPLNSLNSQLARLIFSKINWSDDSMPWERHKSVAIWIVEACLKYAPDTIAGNFFQDSVRQVAHLASKLRRTPEQSFTSWAWDMCSRLRLHAMDRGLNRDACECLDYEMDQVGVAVAEGVALKNPLACYVALQLCQTGHDRNEILESGHKQLHILSASGRYDHVLECIMNLIPLFIDCPDSLCCNPDFLKVLNTTVNVDQTYVKMAKDLVVTDFPGPVVKEMANLIARQIEMYQSYGLKDKELLLTLWAKLCTRLTGWNTNRNIMYLLDNLCKEALMDNAGPRQAVKSVFQELYRALFDDVTGGIMSWLSLSSKGNIGTLLGPVAHEFPWCAFMLMEVEEEGPEVAELWHKLITGLGESDSGSLEQAYKKAAKDLKGPHLQGGSNNLPIYKWCQLLLDGSCDSPMQAMFSHKMFIYITAYPVNESGSVKRVGGKFFEGIVNSMYLSRIQTKLKSIEEYHSDRVTDDDSSHYSFLSRLFRAYGLWIKDLAILEPNLHPAAAPPSMYPSHLTEILSGSKVLKWHFVDFEFVVNQRRSCAQEWARLHYRPVNPDDEKTSPSGGDNLQSLPDERIVERLKSYDCPVPKPSFRMEPPIVVGICDTNMSDTKVFVNSVSPIISVLKEHGCEFNNYLLEYVSLTCSINELVSTLYINTDSELLVKGSCQGTSGPKGQKYECGGPALIRHKFREARKQDIVDHKLTNNRNDLAALVKNVMAPLPSRFLSSAAMIEDYVQFILKMYRRYLDSQTSESLRVYHELGVSFFYLLFDCLGEETCNCPSLRHLLTCSLESLGQSMIADHPDQCVPLLRRISDKPLLAHFLTPLFTPNAGQGFLVMYRIINNINDADSSLAFTLLSKMSVEKWIKKSDVRLNDASKLISLLGKALQKSGVNPDEQRGLVHGLYRQHLICLATVQFPEHYAEIIGLLLIISENQTLDPEVWFDMTNLFATSINKVINGHNPNLWATRALAFATSQTWMQLEEIKQCLRLISQHFRRERRTVGLHGLYTKYKIYVEPLAAYFCLISHVLITESLKIDQGASANEFVQRIWEDVIPLFEPWIMPLSGEQRNETAAWIQQFADSKTLLLPWAPGDVELANLMISVLTSCIGFLQVTIPASKSALCLLFDAYCKSFAQANVKDYVLIPVQNCLITLPWATYYPQEEDMRLMVNLVDAFLPLCHVFLGKLFVQVPWKEIMINNHASPKVNTVSYFLQLVVKLSSEPFVRQDGKLLSLLQHDLPDLPWILTTNQVYDSVMLWYVMSVDCRVIINHDRHPVDDAVLSVLRGSSQIDGHGDKVSTKAKTFVRSTTKLLATCGNKHRNYIAAHEPELREAIELVVADIQSVYVKENQSRELDSLVLGLLGLMNSNSVLPVTVHKVLVHTWFAKPNAQILSTILTSVSSTVQDPVAVAGLLEATIEADFMDGDDDQDAEKSRIAVSWPEVLTLIKFPEDKQKVTLILDAAVSGGHCLTLYAVLRQRRPQFTTIEQEETLLSSLLDWFRHLHLNEKSEYKLPLLYKEYVCLSLRQLNCGASEATVVKYLVDLAEFLWSLHDDAARSWNLLGALGFSTKYKPTPRARFLALSLSYYLLTNLVEGPRIKTKASTVDVVDLKPLRKERLMQAEAALQGLTQNQAYLGLVDMIDWVLKKTSDARNTFDDVEGFLAYLVADNLYTEKYLLST